MKNLNKIFLLITLVFFTACDLDLLDDPNSPSPDNLDVNFTLNQIQVNFSDFFEEVTEPTAEAVRLEYMFNTYEANFISTNANLSNAWRIAYANLLTDFNTLIPIAEANGQLAHAGVARVLKGYVLLTLVDLFGDVPYSEALQGGENLFPKVDTATSVYDEAMIEINKALSNFSNIDNGTPNITNDLYFGNNMGKWAKLANTLKLKYYLNKGMGTEFQAIVSSGDIISSSSDDFLWQASGADANSQHQYYTEEYMAASPGEYMTNYLMWTMAVEKGIEDPRLRYYFYRQVNDFPTDPADLNNVLDCWNNDRPTTYDLIDPDLPFCSLFGRADGYWGRDHADSQGIPPDNSFRTTFGVYPFGGRYDDNEAASIDSGQGLNGAGIWPIMMDSFVFFMRAEAGLTLANATDDPRTMLENGVRASISKVMSSLPNPDSFANIPDAADVDAYVASVLSIYDAAASDEDKMAVIGKEYYISLFGNGLEGYNLYRRTGTPVNLQPTLLGTGTYPRSFFYPSNSVDANTSIEQKQTFAEQVFWDNNPANFIQ